MAISAITLESKADTTASYSEVKADYETQGITAVKGVLENGIKTVQAEQTYQESDPTLYPISNNSSPANQPYSYNKQKINSIGGTRWQNPGQWISWTVDVPESGLYEIGYRSKQNFVRDINCVRSLYIDGEIPFQEASNLEFEFDTKLGSSCGG